MKKRSSRTERKRVLAGALSLCMILTMSPVSVRVAGAESQADHGTNAYAAGSGHYDDNGFCTGYELNSAGEWVKKSDADACSDTNCSGYEPADLTTDQYDMDEDGKKDRVYEISNAGQLYWFAGLVNGDESVCTAGVTVDKSANAILTKDIVVNEDLISSLNLDSDGEVTGTVTARSWTPISSEYNSGDNYTGIFEGNKKKISGLYMNNKGKSDVGVFGNVETGCRISNVGVVDSYFCGKNSVAGICGYAYKAMIKGCYNAGMVRGTGYYVGGVCAKASKATIEDSYNAGTVYGTSGYIGGLCGCSDVTTIKNSHNIGKVSGTGDRIGGLCGYTLETTIIDCYNTGAVSGTGECVGGLCGLANNSSPETEAVIKDSYNAGAVSGKKNYAGGLCGKLTASNAAATTLQTSYNTGEVNGARYYVGGLCGGIDGNKVTVTNSYNTGKVSSEKDDVGGLCGDLAMRMSNDITITNSYNIGELNGAGSGDGGLYGSGQEEFVTNSYYLATEENENGGKTLQQFQSGEVAYLLSQGTDGEVWKQTLEGEEKENAPSLAALSKIVYRYSYTFLNCDGSAKDLVIYGYTNDESKEDQFISDAHVYEVDSADHTQHTCSVCNKKEIHTYVYKVVENRTDEIQAVCDICSSSYTVKLTAPTKADEELSYDGTKKAAKAEIIDGHFGEIVPLPEITYATVTDGTISVYGENAPKDAGSYKAKLTLGSGKNAASVMVDYTIAKVTPVVAEAPAASAITYGQTLAESTLLGGKVTYSDADGTVIPGTFAWKDGNIMPAVSDSDATAYDVIFTPDDNVNYNAINMKLTLDIQKNAKTPNTPATEWEPMHYIEKVGDVILPENWSWSDADKDTALVDGMPVTARAVYTGEDKGNYVTESVVITLTRSATAHKLTEVKAKEATTTEAGNKAYYVCDICGRYFEDSEGTKEITDKDSVVIPAKSTTLVVPGGSSNSTPGNTNAATPTITPSGVQKAKPVGTKQKDSTGTTYKVTDAKSKIPTVQYVAPNSNATSIVTIPATVTIDKVTYKVTSIADNAFKGNKKIKKMVIGDNIISIGKNAFAKCANLTSITIGKNVIKIGKNAFSGCKKLKSVLIKSKKLTTKSVAKGAFSGIGKKTVVKVPKSMYKTYKKLLLAKGLNKKVKVKK